MIVSNIVNNNGNKVANQFTIADGDTEIFQSYETPIAKKEGYTYTISSNYNYSNTTSKYFKIWLQEWGFTDDDVKSIKKWALKADVDNILTIGYNTFTYVEEL